MDVQSAETWNKGNFSSTETVRLFDSQSVAEFLPVDTDTVYEITGNIQNVGKSGLI
jgi:hypothetical protein